MKIRLDERIKGMCTSRSQAKLLISEGYVLCDGKKITKPGILVDEDVPIEILQKTQYVSRGGEKLKKALSSFKIDVNNLVSADIGASTGGFTDCLLQNGAKKIYCIDVGHNQLNEKLKNNHRVINMEGVNIKNPLKLPEKVDIAVCDLSFISLKLVLHNIAQLVKTDGHIIVLIKPQFEAGKGVVNKQGIIKNKKIREKVLEEFKEWCTTHNFNLKKIIESPIQGKGGNIEFLGQINT